MPEPVAMSTSASRPPSEARSAGSCRPRKSLKPKTARSTTRATAGSQGGRAAAEGGGGGGGGGDGEEEEEDEEEEDEDEEEEEDEEEANIVSASAASLDLSS